MDTAGHTLDPDGEEYITFTHQTSEGSDISNILIISKLGDDSDVDSIQWAAQLL